MTEVGPEVEVDETRQHSRLPWLTVIELEDERRWVSE